MIPLPKINMNNNVNTSIGSESQFKLYVLTKMVGDKIDFANVYVDYAILQFKHKILKELDTYSTLTNY